MKKFKDYIQEDKKTPTFYYISSGRRNAQYTLRMKYNEVVWFNTTGGPQSSLRERDYHVKNLGRDYGKAIEKAKDYVKKLKVKGQNIQFQDVGQKELNKYQEKLPSKSYIKFGKYARTSIEEIVEKNPDYAMWLYKSLYNKLTPYQIKHIETVLKKEVNQIKKEQRKAEQAKREAERKEKQAGEEWAKVEENKVLRAKGTVVKIDYDDRFYGSSTYRYTIVTEKGYLVWFSTSKKAFNEVDRGDTVEVEIQVSGKKSSKYGPGMSYIVFGKRPKLIKHKKTS